MSKPTPTTEPIATSYAKAHWFKKLQSAVVTVLALLILLVFLAFIAGIPLPGLATTHAEETAPLPPPLGVHRVKETPHTLMVPEDVRLALGIRKNNKEHVEAAKVPTTTRPLVLSGSTTLDPTRVSRIRARFAPAEVVEIGRRLDPDRRSPSGESEYRQLRAGDWVKKGDLLGVFYSVDVGQKKNDLIDALVQQKLDEDILDRAEKSSAIPEVMRLTFRRNVEADRNAIAKAQNTLKIWGVPKEDIDAVYKEAEEINKRNGKRQNSKADQWARVELKAAGDGVIVESNVTLHEMVVDNTVNLFQIAKVDRLLVSANAPEDDLPTLLKLSPDRKRWTVRPLAEQRGGIVAAEGIAGPIDDISYIIDPNQHNALVKGHIDNPVGRDGRPALRSGQFVSCTIQLPPPKNTVEVPITAIVDDGRQCVVFVQTDPAKPEFTLRRVKIAQRFEKTALVRSELTAKEQELTPEEKELELLPCRPLKAGERILTTGVLELKKELEDRESKETGKQ